jgi:transposase
MPGAASCGVCGRRACRAETVEWLQRFPAPVRVAYEAGPTGYGLARACAAAGIACTVAAPSKIPRASGDKVKTDRCDAERLARLLRLGELVAVRVPEPHQEAARDLVRAREDARGELMRARHRLSKLLLRHGLVYDASAWTLAHDAWLRRQQFDSRPLALAFDECYGAVLQAKTRRDTLDRAISELADEPPFAEVVGRLCCLRGVSTLTALALTVELGDWTRFRPQSLGPFLGLTPSEDSTGERRRLGAITKTGNTHARRLLVEAAWHQRRPLRESATLERRRRDQPASVRARADQSARRLHQRWHALERRGKRRTLVAVAVARELAGHCWALGDHVTAPRATARRGERTGARDARSDPRYSYEPPHAATLDPRERHRSSPRTPGHAVPTRAYQPRHDASTSCRRASTSCRRAPPAETRGPQTRASEPCDLTNLTPYQLSSLCAGERDAIAILRRLLRCVSPRWSSALKRDEVVK